MIETIRAVVQNILTHWDLTEYCAGTVLCVDPLQVRISDRLILTARHLILTFDPATLAAGDKLVLLKVLRGQKYILLAKAVSA